MPEREMLERKFLRVGDVHELQIGDITVKLTMSVEARGEEFAATTNPFAITGYGKTEEVARERAVMGVNLLLTGYATNKDSLIVYLKHRGVEYKPVENAV